MAAADGARTPAPAHADAPGRVRPGDGYAAAHGVAGSWLGEIVETDAEEPQGDGAASAEADQGRVPAHAVGGLFLDRRNRPAPGSWAYRPHGVRPSRWLARRRFCGVHRIFHA